MRTQGQNWSRTHRVIIWMSTWQARSFARAPVWSWASHHAHVQCSHLTHIASTLNPQWSFMWLSSTNPITAVLNSPIFQLRRLGVATDSQLHWRVKLVFLCLDILFLFHPVISIPHNVVWYFEYVPPYCHANTEVQLLKYVSERWLYKP